MRYLFSTGCRKRERCHQHYHIIIVLWPTHHNPRMGGDVYGDAGVPHCIVVVVGVDAPGLASGGGGGRRGISVDGGVAVADTVRDLHARWQDVTLSHGSEVTGGHVWVAGTQALLAVKSGFPEKMREKLT
ncbi:hypothetical protein AVEN_268570-1 [Araneus ventricosus]|uniref:Uncharacterized protein n=1 Tax=Araneus ventricosus TaxID=182803 RepID=A0A4Y2U6S1_ARAVE|nr:hypothetical protein AVEN_268570-1 [Araneus ventricosus]